MLPIRLPRTYWRLAEGISADDLAARARHTLHAARRRVRRRRLAHRAAGAEGANFDAIGPDRYLMALGALMLTPVSGVCSVDRSLAPSRKPHRRPGRGGDIEAGADPGMLAAFAVLVPVLGFSLTCFLFLAAQLRVQGDWPWWLSLGVAAPIALAFDVAFMRVADMSLPKGSVWG
jgi:hypothetical protein